MPIDMTNLPEPTTDALTLLRDLAAAVHDGESLAAVRAWEEAGYPGIPLQRASAVDDGLWLCACPNDENTCKAELAACDDCGLSRPEGVAA